MPRDLCQACINDDHDECKGGDCTCEWSFHNVLHNDPELETTLEQLEEGEEGEGDDEEISVEPDKED